MDIPGGSKLSVTIRLALLSSRFLVGYVFSFLGGLFIYEISTLVPFFFSTKIKCGEKPEPQETLEMAHVWSKCPSNNFSVF